MKNLSLLGILCLTMFDLTAQDLYVVAATTSANNPWMHGSSILKVSDRLSSTSEIFSQSEGTYMVLISPEDRWLTVVSNVQPRKLAVIHLDRPEKAYGFVLSRSPQIAFRGYFVREPSAGLRFAALRREVNQEAGTEVIRFQLDGEPSLVAPNPTGDDDFKFVELTGTSGPAGLGYTDQMLARVDPANKTAVLRGNMHSEFTLPSTLVATSQRHDLFIQVMNRHLVVMRGASNQRGASVRDPDSVWWLNRVSKQWHNLPVEGEPEVRGFGRWFAVTERQTTRAVKRERKARRPHAQYTRLTGPDIDRVFNNFEVDGKGWNYTGTFRIIDGGSDSEREWILETGNENSEVLLIEGRTVVYRIEDAIWQATLEASGTIAGAKRHCVDPRILDAHWAFFSNSTSK